LNRRTGKLNVAFAGHPPLLHLDTTGAVNRISAEGDLLGAFDTPYFESVETRVEAGDRIFFFSDGLIETFYGQKITRAEGIRNLEKLLLSRRELTLADMVAETVQRFCAGNENPGDDILLLGVEV
jgi:sigma-B regulation protein RsbU (phosphoserine phosphatase)